MEPPEVKLHYKHRRAQCANLPLQQFLFTFRCRIFCSLMDSLRPLAALVVRTYVPFMKGVRCFGKATLNISPSGVLLC